jgi:two-component system response regulator
MSPNQLSILLVEDNPDDEALTLRALAKHRIANRVEVARDGQEALDRLFDARAPLPTVVLLDLELPKLDGLEVLLQVRSHPRTRHLPVVVLTSSNEERDRVEAYERGVNSCVRKPVDFVEFVDAVGQLGLYWLVLDQPPPTLAGE